MPWLHRPARHGLCRADLIVALLGAVSGAARAASLAYEDARTLLRSVSDLQQSVEAGVSARNYEARSADSLGLPEVL
jgi:hypothetical protein